MRSRRESTVLAPPNTSFERTGLGRRGSLRSVSVIVARRSTQISSASAALNGSRRETC